jgi:excisionase family DNA binding protein
MADPALCPIDQAIVPYAGVTVPMVRAWIRRGELPAVRAGKSYLIDPRDLALRLTPKLRPRKEGKKRETPTARALRQLRNAGIA